MILVLGVWTFLRTGDSAGKRASGATKATRTRVDRNDE
jgi:hypothetical protein